MTNAHRQSPLSHRQPIKTPNSAAAIREIAFRGVVALRGTSATVAAIVQGVLGISLPTTVRSTASSDTTTVIWLAPDEWVTLTAPNSEAGVIAGLAKAANGAAVQIVDVTDYYTTIEVAGAKTRELLAKLIAFDLHPRAFKPGEAVATRIAKGTCWLHCIQSGPDGKDDAFHLIVRRSMADYFWCLLADAGREWGMPGQAPRGVVKLHAPHLQRTLG